MNTDSQNLIGFWDVYAGTVHSQLLLQPDGNFSNLVWGGTLGYWGKWSVEMRAGQAVLVLSVTGAQPTIYQGPFGPVPMNWPPSEVWAISAIQPNQVIFWGAVMLRHLLAPGAERPQTQPGMTSNPSAALFTRPNPAPAPPALSPAQAPIPPGYVVPPPQPAPVQHSAPVMLQWNNLNKDTISKIQQMNLEDYKNERQTNDDISNMESTLQTKEFADREKIILDGYKANHESAENYINWLRSTI